MLGFSMLGRACYGPGKAAGASTNDPYFANVALLLGFEGADGSTNFVDESSSSKTGTAGGNAQIDTSARKFGSASGLFDGSSDYVTYADSDDWYWPGEFTIEAWVRPNASSLNILGIANQWSNITGTCAWQFYYFWSSTSSKSFRFTFSPTGSSSSITTVSQPGTNIDQSIFHHVAVSRDAADKLRLFVDGVMVASATVSGGTNVSQPMRVGSAQGAGVNAMNGWIDELRITKGVARYASDAGFVVPTEPFPRS